MLFFEHHSGNLWHVKLLIFNLQYSVIPVSQCSVRFRDIIQYAEKLQIEIIIQIIIVGDAMHHVHTNALAYVD